MKPSDGKPVSVPTQDMVLGSYYLTMDKEQELKEKINISTLKMKL